MHFLDDGLHMSLNHEVCFSALSLILFLLQIVGVVVLLLNRNRLQRLRIEELEAENADYVRVETENFPGFQKIICEGV